MLIIIILMAMVICGAMLIVFDAYHENFLGILLVNVGLIGLCACLITIAITQIPAETEYQQTIYQKEILEYRLEKKNENITGNELLYNDIVEFNNNLRSIKKWSTNPWTNWFNNAKIATIDYIEIPGLNPIQP